MFLLFTHPTEDYIKDTDYIEIAVEKLDDAYRQTHLWINVF